MQKKDRHENDARHREPLAEQHEEQTEEALDRLKFEVADDVDVPLEEDGDNGDLTARQLGRVGGQMVRRLIKEGEEALSEQDDDGSV